MSVPTAVNLSESECGGDCQHVSDAIVSSYHGVEITPSCPMTPLALSELLCSLSFQALIVKLVTLCLNSY